jgi:hypothetical protein
VAAQRVRSLADHRPAVRRGERRALGHRRITDLAGDPRDSPRAARGRRRRGGAARRADPQPAGEGLRRAHQPCHIAGHVALWSLSRALRPALLGRSAGGLAPGRAAGACRMGTGRGQDACRLLRPQAGAGLVQRRALPSGSRQHGCDRPARRRFPVGIPAGSAGPVAGRRPHRRGYRRPRHHHRRQRQPRPPIRAGRLRRTIRVPCHLPACAAGRRGRGGVAARSLPAPHGAHAPAVRPSGRPRRSRPPR